MTYLLPTLGSENSFQSLPNLPKKGLHECQKKKKIKINNQKICVF